MMKLKRENVLIISGGDADFHYPSKRETITALNYKIQQISLQ